MTACLQVGRERLQVAGISIGVGSRALEGEVPDALEHGLRQVLRRDRLVSAHQVRLTAPALDLADEGAREAERGAFSHGQAGRGCNRPELTRLGGGA